jgi:hypothetical protein
MIANLDQVASVEMTLSMPISETGADRAVRWQAD